MATVETSRYWQESGPLPQFPTLDRNLRVDVVVVGGGITGLTAAYLLNRAGHRVAVVERRRCAEVDTCNTTAHLTCVIDTPLHELVKTFGDDHARATWDAGLSAIAQIDEIVRRHEMACHFEWVPGYQHAPPDGAPAFDFSREVETANRLGFDAREIPRVPVFETPGIEFPDQARFHPRRYLRGVLEQLTAGGASVFEHTEVDEISDDPLAISAAGHRITCDYLVIATHTPLQGNAGLVSATLFQSKLFLYSSYAIGGRAASGRIPDALFWDTKDPYDYLRVDRRRGFDYVIFGGADHKTGQADDPRQCFAELESRLARIAPDIEITDRWSGQVIETNDGLPYMGEMAERQFVATGFSGNGMTFGTLAGMMAHDAVTGQKNPWRELFDVSRTKIRGGLWDYLKENKDYPYYMIRDRFAGAEGQSLRSLPRGSGKILDLNGTRVAAFRDLDGSVSLRSPVCTHMGCHVRWNDAERTWDCPCHGSRFLTNGRVLAGPAESPLESVEVPGR